VNFDTLVAPRPGERASERVFRSSTYDIWLIRWGTGSRTALHDHGGSAGALYVVAGELVEHRPSPTVSGRPLRRRLRELDHNPMSRSHVHEIANESVREAASIHVYSPPLVSMNHYEERRSSRLWLIHREAIAVDDGSGYVADG
jgi:hypothetical protein